MSPEVEAAIRRAAREEGVSEARALATAERESSFNPYARSSKTILGMFQMKGDLRNKYGSGDSVDPYTQAKAWSKFTKDSDAEMASTLGRQPTDAEGYLGHHFGGARAGRAMRMDPNTPVDQVFNPYELSLNPHIVKAGTTGNVSQSILGDMSRRMAKYGDGEPLDFSGQVSPMDFSSNAKPDVAPKASEPLDFSTQVAVQ